MSKLHLFFLPFMAHGHIIPMLDMAKLFNSRGVRTTILSTLAFSDPIKKAQESGIEIGLIIIRLPNRESGLPEYIQRLDQVTTVDLVQKFVEAISLLQEPVEKLIQEFNPNCLVSDTFFPWTTDSAAKFGIPRLVFHGTGYLARCASEQMRLHKPFKNVSSDSEPFILPYLPHQLKFTRTQISPFDLRETEGEFAELIFQSREADRRSYGVAVNSFYELESSYADHYRNFLGIKAWNIGPLLLCNNGDEEKAGRGRKSSIDEHECLAWLDSKKPGSVVYACFGSMVSCTQAQLHEIAFGLESSGQDFIWVVRERRIDEINGDFLPNEFEERIREKGLIINGWAPQMLILDHPSIGAFVTHCGWNSILEGVCAGVPMVTWPMFAEQFFNEKLVTQVLRIGVSVGNKQWRTVAIEGVPREAVAEAVRHVMVSGEVAEMRNRAKCYGEMARKAVEEGGSSYTDLSALIEELSVHRRNI
ncbi:scopoletin glucosyltransferase-like [Primulina huaijiensis]|uniref:scopoletin glucosyltransferase-like n=1 Tax=Primulina huaijiensis TaxID=1492673 RepID=UPI003CC78AD2